MMPSRSSLQIQITKSRQEHDKKQHSSEHNKQHSSNDESSSSGSSDDVPIAQEFVNLKKGRGYINDLIQHFSICSSQETTQTSNGKKD